PRTSALHTNATIADRDTEVLIVIDTLDDLSTELPGEHDHDATPASSIDIAVSAAATIADHYLGLGDRVGLHDLGQVVGPVRAGSGTRQRALIMERLALGQAERAGEGGRVRPIGRLRAGRLVLCCTPLLSPEVIDELLRLLHRGATVLVIDTLPTQLGRLASETTPHRWRDRRESRLRGGRFWSEAWALRRIGRKRTVDGLSQVGVAVVPWQGIASLGQVVTELAARRTLPRRIRG